MKIGYARVSTEDQHLDLQLSALEAYGCDAIFYDHGASGSRFDREGFLEALDATQRGDTLVVWRLDRLGRSLGHLVKVISGLEKRGIEFVSLTESIDTKSPTGMLMFHMIAALAEFERSLISERTRAGMAEARKRGSRLGRPRVQGVAQPMSDALRELVPKGGINAEAEEVAVLLETDHTDCCGFLRCELLPGFDNLSGRCAGCPSAAPRPAPDVIARTKKRNDLKRVGRSSRFSGPFINGQLLSE
jgi:DNA invertase Pin-like site-specific DNA recombinase